MATHGVIASLKEFQKAFPKAPKKGERHEALEKYFAIGGVIRVHESEKEWPKLSYPSSTVIDTKVRELRAKKASLKGRLGTWKKSYRSASLYHQVHQFKKFKEPLYWKHLGKIATDPKYRKEADSVKLPAHLVSDDKWKPMVKMFVNDAEYRAQLSETVSTSIVYKKNKKVAQYADDLKDFRMNASGKQVTELEKKLEALGAAEEALKEMQKWSKE